MFWEENFCLHVMFKMALFSRLRAGWQARSTHNPFACTATTVAQPLSEQLARWGMIAPTGGHWPWVTTSPKSQLGAASQRETEPGNGRTRSGVGGAAAGI